MKADHATLQHAAPLYGLPLEQRHIGRFLRLRAAKGGDCPYLTFGANTYMFAETEKRCRDLARGLVYLGHDGTVERRDDPRRTGIFVSMHLYAPQRHDA